MPLHPDSDPLLPPETLAPAPSGAPSVAHTQGRPEWVSTRDGRQMYAMVLSPDTAGDPAPATVVFEAGAGATRSSWALVQPPVGRFALAIVYDRAGLGRSPADPDGRTLARMGADLVDLLDHYTSNDDDHQGGRPHRFVLVGHSAGGPIVRLAASLRPELIAGLVLVDPTDEAAEVLFSRAFRRGEKVVLRVNLALARLGLLKLAYRRLLRAAPAPDVRADLEREAFTAGLVRTQTLQARTYLDELAAWRPPPDGHGPPELGHIPVTVISGARTGDGMTRSIRTAANAAHAHRAARSPHGRHVLAERSAHYVPLTDADLIVEEIRRLVP